MAILRQSAFPGPEQRLALVADDPVEDDALLVADGLDAHDGAATGEALGGGGPLRYLSPVHHEVS